MNVVLNKKIKTFRNVRKFLSKIPLINYGGCGVAALSMYRWLKKNREYSPEIILLYYKIESYNTNKDNLDKEIPTKLLSSQHCGINYHGLILDSEELVFYTQYSWKQITNEKGLLKLLNTANNWNMKFEREHIPEIAEKLEIDLSDVHLKDYPKN